MHKFYLTNDLGGGGTNVSRLYDYIELFDLSNIGILLNYYYIKGHAKPAFDVPLISRVSNFNDIQDFISYSKEYFKTKRHSSNYFKSNNGLNVINGSILDNGCGNILRNVIGKGDTHERIQSYIKPFFDFAESLNFDLSVAMDLAMKYTYKANEVENPAFMSKWKQLASDNRINLGLLTEALKIIKIEKYRHKILAPLHGYDYQSFSSYLYEIEKLEEEYSIKFGGFALGGIADSRKLDDRLWKVPNGFTRNLKSAYICYNLIKEIRSKTSRHIHVLGAGNIYILPFLINAGADSSDCHSAWRRASDGGIEKAKILIPLFDKEFNFINKKNCLEYVKIGELTSKDYTFNCGYSIQEIQEMLMSNNREDFYFAEIIMYYEAILQYNILIDFISKNNDKYLDLLSNTPDKILNNNYKVIRSALNI